MLVALLCCHDFTFKFRAHAGYLINVVSPANEQFLSLWRDHVQEGFSLDFNFHFTRATIPAFLLLSSPSSSLRFPFAVPVQASPPPPSIFHRFQSRYLSLLALTGREAANLNASGDSSEFNIGALGIRAMKDTRGKFACPRTRFASCTSRFVKMYP